MPILSRAARRRFLVASSVVASAAALLPAVAAADAADATNSRSEPAVTAAAWAAGRAEHGADVTQRQALAAYWTPARMRAARPAEPARASGEPTVAGAASTSARPTPRPAATRRKPFSVPPARGRKLGRQFTRSLYNPNLNPGTPTAYTNGKVFFTLNGVNKVCSAAIVNSEGADTVWTAGHCVHGGGSLGWATNWVFVPAYDDDLANPAPYGVWSASYLVSRTAWIQSSYAGEDMGVAIMNTNFGGWHIVHYFGGHGFRANLSKYQRVYAFGYPSSTPYDGGNLWGCSSDVMPTWDYGTISSDRLRSGCDFTYGASGGPWLLYYNGSWGYLNGITSAGYPNVYTNSPYFGANAQSLYDSTRYL